MSSAQTASSAAECARLQAKYPGQVPIVVCGAKSGKAQYMALPRDATVAELEAAVRAALSVSGRKMTLAIEGCTPAATATMGDLADACRHADGFLYVSMRTEKAMGAILPGVAGPCFATDSGGI